MSELVIEILCEEIPARMQNAKQIHDTFIDVMKECELYVQQDVRLCVSPTRLLFITECETSANVTTLIQNFITQMRWPKSMRWDSSNISWVRPIRNICCIFDGETVAGSVADIQFTNISYGHKTLAPQSFVVEKGRIIEQLREHYIIVDAEERKKIIMTEFARIEKELEIKIDNDEKLLDEVVGLVDYPVVLVGKIQRQYSDLPNFVLISPMKKQQRYFPTYSDSDGTLSRYFIVIANTNRNTPQIIRGNERVLNARLDDAKFYFAHTESLSNYLEALKCISVHDAIGSMYDKVCRMSVIAKAIAPTMSDDVERMCMLSKCDLATGIVGEFPELQGLIGSHYAMMDGEKPEIATAIAEQYMYDTLPQTQFGSILAIADKIEQLVSFFAADLRPSGSKDPFALRRSALFILKTIRKNKISLDLDVLLKVAGATLPNYNEQVHEDLLKFFRDRLISMLKSEYNHSLAESVSINYNVCDIFSRVEYLNNYDSSNLLSAYRRAYKITTKDGADINAGEYTALQTESEQRISDMLDDAPSPHADIHTYVDFLEQLSYAITEMMDHIKVSEDKVNRISLLKSALMAYDRFASFHHLI